MNSPIGHPCRAPRGAILRIRGETWAISRKRNLFQRTPDFIWNPHAEPFAQRAVISVLRLEKTKTMQKTAILVFVALAATTLPALAQLGPSDPGTAVMSPDSLTAPSMAPQPASKLQELVARNLSRYVDRKPEQTAAESFYQGRNYQPI